MNTQSLKALINQSNLPNIIQQWDDQKKNTIPISINSSRIEKNAIQQYVKNYQIKENNPISLPPTAKYNVAGIQSQTFSQKSAQFLQKAFFPEAKGGNSMNEKIEETKQRHEQDKNKKKMMISYQKDEQRYKILEQYKSKNPFNLNVSVFNTAINASNNPLSATSKQKTSTSTIPIQKDIAYQSLQKDITANKDMHKRHASQGLIMPNCKSFTSSNFYSIQNKLLSFILSQKASNDSIKGIGGSQNTLRQRDYMRLDDDYVKENTVQTERIQTKQQQYQHRKINNQQRQRIHTKSLANINNSFIYQQEQSLLVPLNKTGISLHNQPKNYSIELINSQYSTNNSTNKYSFYKDHIDSTRISHQTGQNLNQSQEKYPKLQLDSVLESKNRLNHKLFTLKNNFSSRLMRTNNQSKFIANNNNTSTNSILNTSKDRMESSFKKTQNEMQYLPITNRQVGNEMSLAGTDSTILFFNSELSPRDKSSVTANSSTESAFEKSTKYMNKFIKMNPHLLSQEEKLRKLQQLRQKQCLIVNHIQMRNFEDAINMMKELMTAASQEKELDLFVESIVYIGQLYHFNHDLDNALYSFLQLKYLSEIVGSPQIKMKSLKLLGQLLQDEQDYDLALFLYRRAIHYSWYLNDLEAENDLFDKLGFLYFMKGDISKAKYFHERCIQHQSENPNSENRNQSVYTVSKIFANPDKFIPTLNQMVLAKLGLVTDQQDKLRFSTKISAELQLQILKEDKEINFANHDPSEINPQDLFNQKIIPEGQENVKEYQIIQKILNQKNSFQPIVLRNTQYKDPQSQKIVDHSLLKLTIEEKVQKVKMDVYDNKRLQKKLKEAQVSALINRQTKNQKFYYNHCSPNRNLLGFKYTFKPNSLKLKSYFKKIENMILKSEN